MLYYIYKYILIGPILRVMSFPRIQGKNNIPDKGPVILASNHLAVFDSFFLPLLVPRRIYFWAKSAYFTEKGFKGKLKKFFFTSSGQLPINRDALNAGEEAVRVGTQTLAKGKVLGIYPEGTRSPDGKLYKAKSGIGRMYIAFPAPIIPVAMFGTRNFNPPGSRKLRPGRVSVVIGSPIDCADIVRNIADPHKAAQEIALRVQNEIRKISQQEFVDRYAAEVKEEQQKNQAKK